MNDTAQVAGLFTGEPEHRWEGKPFSAIRKRRADGPLKVTSAGLAGDAQADLEVHGGPDKAVHIYPAEHYAHWRRVFPEMAAIYGPGGFGENISSEGLSEADLCIGDVLAAGGARLQISQGRQPCWKLNLHTDNPAQGAAFQKTGKTGWYVRVLQEGTVEEGDTLSVVDRPCPEWNLREVILARFSPRLDPAVAVALSELEQLAEPWRSAFARKVDPDYEEDIAPRLPG